MSSDPTIKPTLVILAAGMGSRYGGLKQLDAMGPSGEVVLDYSVFDAIRAGFGKVVFVIRRDFEEQFRSQIGSRFQNQIQVEYAFQQIDDLPAPHQVPEGRSKPWGTAHALLAAEPFVNEPFLMINADDFYGRDAFQKMGDQLRKAEPADGIAHFSMVGFLLKNTLSEFGSVARGVCVCSPDQLLTSVTEMTKIVPTAEGAENREDPDAPVPLSGDAIVSMNFFGFTPAIFPHLRQAFKRFLEAHGSELKSECYVPKEVDALIQSGQAVVHVLQTTGKWFGVTYPEDKDHVVGAIRALTAAGDYPTQLWN